MAVSIYVEEMESPIGALVLCKTDVGLCHIEFGRFDDRFPQLHAWAERQLGETVWTKSPGSCDNEIRQLRDYFVGLRTQFDIVLDMRGTDFQCRVWRALTHIPFGESRSYKQIGEAIGSPKAMRAVGGANNKNPIPIVVPCHRVIGASGDLVGYGGGLSIKTFLLDLERIPYQGMVNELT